MAWWRFLACAAGLVGFVGEPQSQTFNLSDTAKADSFHLVHLSMSLTGTLKMQQDGKPLTFKESVTATHDYVERLLETGPDGMGVKAARHYKEAAVAISVEADKQTLALRPDRTVIVSQRSRDGLVNFCPRGPLTREELDVTDHFDTLAIGGILPPKAVAVGDTWQLSTPAAQALCHVQSLSEHTLTAKLARVEDGIANITVEGMALGIDLGGHVHAKVNATCQFDLAKQRLVSVDWNQNDEREAGPVSPASSLAIAIKMRRTPVGPVIELSDAVLGARTSQPAAEAVELVFQDARGRFELRHARGWRLVGRSDDHIVWRLMDRGEFVAQVSVAHWKQAGPGKHLTTDEIKQIAGQSPGWTQQTTTKAEEVKLPSDQWTYLVAGEGILNGTPAVQHVYAVASPSGDQALVTFTMTPAQMQKLGSRDIEFLHGFLLRGARRLAK